MDDGLESCFVMEIIMLVDEIKKMASQNFENVSETNLVVNRGTKSVKLVLLMILCFCTLMDWLVAMRN